MEPIATHSRATAHDDKRPTRSFSLPNGALRKHHHPRAADPPAPAEGVYRECMKNHAASLGGHALDGCGEFMPSPAADPALPSSLVCAACGCHRNFHRRLLPPAAADHDDGDDGLDDDDDDDDDDDEGELRRSPAFSSAPHTLLALSHGLPGSMLPTPGPDRPPPPSSSLPRKRFRTKFTAEQKGRMQELSERLGWRMQKRDDAVVEECCREIGVSKGVFKVWMHNNKHTFLGTASSRRKDLLASSAAVAAASDLKAHSLDNGIGGANEGSKDSSYVVNGSSSSS